MEKIFKQLVLCIISFLTAFSIPSAYSQVSSQSFIPAVGILEKEVPSVKAAKINAQMNEYYQLKKRNPQAALVLLKQILSLDPQNLIANKEMAYLLINQNQLQEAKNYLNKVLQIDPKDPAAIKQLGFIQDNLNKQQFGNSNKDKAQQQLDASLNYYYALNKINPQKARIELQKLAIEYPTNLKVQREMAFSLLNEKNYQLALPYFLTVEKLTPKDYDLKMQIGYLFANLKQVDKAYAYFQEAAKTDNPALQLKAEHAIATIKAPQIPSVKFVETEQLLNQYYELKKTNPKAAKLVLQKLVTEYPTNLKAQREMAFSLLNEKNYQLALQHFLEVEKLTPKDYALKMQIGYLFANLKQVDKAYTYFQEAANTDNPALQLKAAQAIATIKASQIHSLKLVETEQLLNQYYELKKTNPKAAKLVLQKLVTEYPTNLKAQQEMAFSLLNEKNYQLALQHFLEVEKLTPKDYALKMQIGYLFANLKQVDKAYTYFQEAAKTDNLALQLKAAHAMAVIKAQRIPSVKLVETEQLLNQYYELKKTNPKAAKLILQKLVTEYPTNLKAQQEMAFSLLNEKNYQLALQHFLEVEKLTPKDYDLKMQIGYLFVSLKQVDKAYTYFQEAAKTDNPALRLKATQAMANITTPKATQVKLTEAEQLLNQYYELNKTNPKAAKLILQQLVAKYPTNIIAQREMAFSLVKDKNNELALQHFLIVEKLTPNDYDIKMQIGYLLNNLGHPEKAYYYFSKTTKTTDQDLKLKANQAMTNLSGLQTKIWPNPWFADIYLYPLYYSRFVMMIYPGIGRVGRTFGKEKQLEAYLINRTTWDNRSGAGSGINALPQIFEDDAAISSFGARYTLFYKSSIPALKGLKLYAEVGKAYDLIRREPNRRWRNDFRGGLLYWYGWGAKHNYVNKLGFPLKQIGSFYMDVTYFTRYSDNIIGYYSLKEGLRALEYKTSEVNIFARIRGGFDKNRQFFNNFVEIGPGIEFIPNHRYNFSIRFEHLKGYYIPVNNSQSKNPYGPSYNNNITIAEFYVRF